MSGLESELDLEAAISISFFKLFIWYRPDCFIVFVYSIFVVVVITYTFFLAFKFMQIILKLNECQFVGGKPYEYKCI